MIKRDTGKSQVESSHFFQFQRPSSRICVLKILERRESIGHCRSIMVSPLCIHSGLVSATFSQAINYLWLRMPKGQEKFRKNFMEPENFRLSPNFFDANDKFEPRFEKKFFFKISNLHEFQILRKFWFYFENLSGWHLTMDFWKIESAVHYARLWRILLWVSKLIFFPMLLC